MMRPLMMLLILLFALAGPAAAQVLPSAGGGTAEDVPAAPTPKEALLEILKDEAARTALIAELEAETNEGSSGDGEGAAAETEEPRTLGRQVSGAVAGVAEEAEERAERLWIQAKRLPNRVSDFFDAVEPAVLVAAAQALGLVVALTYAVYLLLRVVLRRITRHLSEAARGHRYLRRAALSLCSAVVDALIVAVSVFAASLALILIDGGSDESSLSAVQVNYLTAFYVVGWTFVALRAALSPRFEHLRLLSISTPAAQTIWRWLTISGAVLGYGQLVIVPFVQREAGYLPAFAVSSVIGAFVVGYAMRIVWKHRQPVAHWLHGGTGDAGAEEEEDMAARIEDIWHWPVLIYLAFLLVIVILRPGNVLIPILITSGKLAGTVIAGLAIRGWLKRLAARGVRLPRTLSRIMPALERRLNAILPTLVLFLRVLLAVVVLGAILTILGALAPASWLGDGEDIGFAAELLTILFMLTTAVVLWLAIASWVDYRLNPFVGRLPSSRERTLLTLLFNATTIAIVVITAMLVLSELGVNIAPLLASAGVLGLAIGFGAQKMVQDIITGIFIQFENAINVGDVVTVGGVTGVVEKLTVRSVSLRDLHGVFHIIPFSSVDMVSNYMRDFAYSVCDMGIAYREDIDEAKQAMFDAFAELQEDEEQAPLILGELEWFGLNSFGDSAIVLRARIKTLPGEQWGIGRAYNLILKRIFDERGIEIPFPHQTIYFGEDKKGNAPPLHLKTEAGESA